MEPVFADILMVLLLNEVCMAWGGCTFKECHQDSVCGDVSFLTTVLEAIHLYESDGSGGDELHLLCRGLEKRRFLPHTKVRLNPPCLS